MLAISGASGEGITDALRALKSRIGEDRLRRKVVDSKGSEKATWQP